MTGTLRKIRTKLQITQAELATMLGVHAMTVSKWERGVAEPPPYHRQQIEEAARGVECLTSQDLARVRRLAQDGRGVVALAFLVIAGCDER